MLVRSPVGIRFVTCRAAVFLCLRFNGRFPGGPGSADTRISPLWTLLELMMMELMVTTGAVRRAKRQSNCHRQQTNTQRFTGRMPFLSPNQQSEH